MEVKRVLAAVVASGGRYLVGKRPQRKRHGGLWEFPGGKPEEDETDFEAITRELREELGVIVVSIDAPTFVVSDPMSPFLISFVPTKIKGAPVAHEHERLVWASPAELATFRLAPSDQRFLEQCLLQRSR